LAHVVVQLSTRHEPPPLRTIDLCVVLHHRPVNAVPPSLQIRPLAPNTIVQIGVLPGIDTEDRVAVIAARSATIGHAHSRVGTERADVVGIAGATRRAEGGHVVLLRAEVCQREGRAGQVGAQQFHLARLLVLDDPDKTGAEHGVGGFDHFGAEGVEAGEGVFEVGEEAGGGFGLLWREAVEEHVVVACHGGVVEEGGLGGGAAVFFYESLRFGGCIGGAWEKGFSNLFVVCWLAIFFA
jgi:hypothetical protein